MLTSDFLTKTGIDVKYSTRTVEWFDNELPLHNPHLLESKGFEAMAHIVTIVSNNSEDIVHW
jgi:hypothetical protein